MEDFGENVKEDLLEFVQARFGEDMVPYYDSLSALAKGSYLFIETALALKKNGFLKSFESLPINFFSESYFASVFQKNFGEGDASGILESLKPALGLLCVCGFSKTPVKLRHLTAMYFHVSPFYHPSDILLEKMRKLLHSAGSMVEETEVLDDSNYFDVYVTLTRGVRQWLVSEGAGRFKVNEVEAHYTVFLFLLRKANGRSEAEAIGMWQRRPVLKSVHSASSNTPSSSDKVYDEQLVGLDIFDHYHAASCSEEVTQEKLLDHNRSYGNTMLSPIETFYLLYHFVKSFITDDHDDHFDDADAQEERAQVLQCLNPCCTGRALYIAVKKNELQVVKLLFEIAGENDHDRAVAMLKYRGGSSSILKVAIRRRNFHMVKFLIEKAEVLTLLEHLLLANNENDHFYIMEKNETGGGVNNLFLPHRTPLYLAASRQKFVDEEILKALARATKKSCSNISDVMPKLIPTLGAAAFALVSSGYVEEFYNMLKVFVERDHDVEDGVFAQKVVPAVLSWSRSTSHHIMVPAVLSWSHNAILPPFHNRSLLQVAPGPMPLQKMIVLRKPDHGDHHPEETTEPVFLFRSGEIMKLLEEYLKEDGTKNSLIKMLVDHVKSEQRTNTEEKLNFVEGKFREWRVLYPKLDAILVEITSAGAPKGDDAPIAAENNNCEEGD